jgi:uncharacterized membrane protein
MNKLIQFLGNCVTQEMLGVFAGIVAYCLIVLHSIRGSGGVDEFVPSLAVFFAFVMSLGGIAILIYFIHHIASVAQETLADRCIEASHDRARIERRLSEVSEILETQSALYAMEVKA